jgi:hypothetical protein
VRNRVDVASRHRQCRRSPGRCLVVFDDVDDQMKAFSSLFQLKMKVNKNEVGLTTGTTNKKEQEQQEAEAEEVEVERTNE